MEMVCCVTQSIVDKKSIIKLNISSLPNKIDVCATLYFEILQNIYDYEMTKNYFNNENA